MGLPVLVSVTVGLVWLLAVGTAQLRVVDGAREAARALARGDPEQIAFGRAARVAGDGSTLSAVYADGEVRVTLQRRVSGPGGVFDFLPAVTLDARSVAVVEAGS